MASTTSTSTAPTLALIHEGWNHLMSQRPLAAWGTWQRALRTDPENAAARQALETLESAPDLPLAARKTYRFRKPHGEPQRSRWDRALREADAAELEAAAVAFGRLTEESAEDADAWYNRGLCLAWSGRDGEAIECLDRAASLEADAEIGKAVEAWTLAEVLRQGGGAESLSDDLRFACTYRWEGGETSRLQAAFPELRRIPTPRDPTRFEGDSDELEVFEWLDRKMPVAGAVAAHADLPRVLATVYITPGLLRLSSPRAETLEEVEERLRRLLAPGTEPTERVAAPLPLPFLDADVWTARIPEGTDPALSHQLSREIVETYYENEWIHRPRQGLDGLSPLAASQNARRGDAVARAKLEAIVRLREQLGSRPTALAMYQGYPFDRLRRRLDLEPVEATSVDATDLSCASQSDLESLAEGELDDHPLAEAFQSAAGLRDDALSARFAAELVRRQPPELKRLDLAAVYAPLVRQAMKRGDAGQALESLDRARTLGTDELRHRFDTWRAEILARTGRPVEAATIYRELIASSPASPQVALDAAETLLDNGHTPLARRFLTQARDLARSAGVRWVEAQAERLIETHG
jgi:tetratricopeptide (TPR) repeat protein